MWDDGRGATLAAWERSMRAGGLSERTIKERLRIVAASGLDPTVCTLEEVEAWLADPSWTPSTRRAYQDGIRACLSWCQRRDLRRDNPGLDLSKVRVPKGRPRPVSTNDLEVMLGAAVRRRLRGYLLLAAYAGLRVSEIARVRGEDVHGGWLTVTGKGGKVARVALHPLLAEYAAGIPRHGWWFPSYTGEGPVTGGTVSRVIGDHMRRCGVPGTPHALRHWHGTQLVAAGTQMRVVQEAMRHESLQSTQVYTQVTDEQVRDAVEGLPFAA